MEQMLEAQNVRRRRKGVPELTEDQIRAEVEEAERWRADLAERYRRESEQDLES